MTQAAYYAELDSEGRVLRTLRTDAPTQSMVPCDKPVRIHGRRYAGRIPPRGAVYDAEAEVFAA